MPLSIAHVVIFAIALVGIFVLLRSRKRVPEQAPAPNQHQLSSQPADPNKSEEYRLLDNGTPDGGDRQRPSRVRRRGDSFENVRTFRALADDDSIKAASHNFDAARSNTQRNKTRVESERWIGVVEIS